MNFINSLQELIIELSSVRKDNYKNILENFEIDRRSLSKFENWSQQNYVRNGLYKDDHFEIILLCWEKGQETSVHCHGGEECWMYLLEGEIEEVFYTKDENNTLKEIKTQKLQPSKTSYINDLLGLHKLKNSFDGRSLSLHIYAKPILECSVFDEDQKIFKRKTLSYDTFNGEVCQPDLVKTNLKY